MTIRICYQSYVDEESGRVYWARWTCLRVTLLDMSSFVAPAVLAHFQDAGL